MNKKIFTILLLCLLVSPSLLANTGGGMDLPWTEQLQIVMDMLQGPWIMLLGGLLLGIGGFMIALNKGRAGIQWIGVAVIGIGIIINAPNLIKLFFPNAAGYIG